MATADTRFLIANMLCENAMSHSLQCGLFTLNCELSLWFVSCTCVSARLRFVLQDDLLNSSFGSDVKRQESHVFTCENDTLSMLHCVESFIRVWHRAKACRVDVHEETWCPFIPCFLQICHVYECSFRVFHWYVLCFSAKTWPAYFFARWIATADARLLFAVYALWSYYV